MFEIEVTLKGLSPYSQSKVKTSVKPKDELDDEFERRTWKEHLHTEKGVVFIPPMSVKKSLEECAQYLAEPVKGKGKATYTKHFTAGVMSIEPWWFQPKLMADDVEGEMLFLNADGKKGGGRRVHRMYPRIADGWHASGVLYVIDAMLTADKVREYLEHAGKFIGIGRFRPRNGGFYGRYAVESFEVTNGK